MDPEDEIQGWIAQWGGGIPENALAELREIACHAALEIEGLWYAMKEDR